MRVLFIIFFLSFINKAVPQRYDFMWLAGDNFVIPADSLLGSLVLDFNSEDGNPRYTYSSNFAFQYNYGSQICDQNGIIRYNYTGNYLEDHRHRPVRGYQQICGANNSCGIDPQSTLFLPSVNGKDYLIFTGKWKPIGDTEVVGFYFEDLSYHRIQYDDKADSSIVGPKINIIRDSLDLGRLTACRHANGRDWWILTGRFNRPEIYTILLSKDSVSRIFKQYVNKFNDFGNSGFANFSSDGQFYVITSKVGGLIEDRGRVEFYQFDRCEGLLYNRQVEYLDSIESFTVGCSFSANNKFLYLSTWHYLYRYEIVDGNLQNRQIIGEYDGKPGYLFNNQYGRTNFGSLQLGPDHRMYMNSDFIQTRYLHIINNPDSDDDVEFVPRANYLKAVIQTIPMHPHYRLGPIDNSICDSLGIDNIPWCWWRYQQDSVDPFCIHFTDLSMYDVKEWQWEFGDGTKSNKQTTEHCYNQKGIYRVCLIVRNENGADTLCRTINLNITISQDFTSIMNWEVFPNPSSGVTVVNINHYNPIRMNASIYNFIGEKILTQRVYQGSNMVDLSEFKNGLYIVSVEDEGKIMGSTKLIINK